MLNGLVHIERLDALDLDLDTADAMAAVQAASLDSARLALPRPVGPTTLKALQLGSSRRPVAGVWVARDDDEILGFAVARLPHEDNTDSAHLSGQVHPEARRRGVGRALLAEALALAGSEGRTKIYSGAWQGDVGGAALEAMGFSSQGLGLNAVRRLDLHAAGTDRWQRVYDEALARAGDYELVHQVGPTPQHLLDDMMKLHAAINDAPLDDPDAEHDAWDVNRLRDYDEAMAGRQQTVYRVMARHRASGEWAGLSILCVDEFQPTVAFQEDTSVVRAHRGHRLGLLMKADMLRWVVEERPEVAATDTWNATTNHHMIAVNERLGATVIAHHQTYRLREARPR